MNNFKRGLLAGGVLSLLAAAPITGAMAQDTKTVPAPTPAVSTDASTNLGVTAVDAGKLIGENVYDANGKTVGEIDSVIVDTKGKVTSVVLDVGGWLESDKRISVPWTDLKADADGKIHTSLTKESAKAAAAYSYKDEKLRGKVLNESGQSYAANEAAEPSTDATTSAEAAGWNADGTVYASKVAGLSVVNNANDSVGKIGEVLLDPSGKVSGVIVDVGGFLGIGTHPVKLGWNQIKLVNQDGTLRAVVNLSKDALKQMPEYKASNG